LVKISILIPTRLRAHFLPQLVEDIYNTVSDKSQVETLFWAEPSDVDTINFVQSAMSTNPLIRLVVRDSKAEGLIFPELYNELYKEARASIILVGADDIKFQTPNWDKMVLDCFDQYDDKILLVNPRDGIQNGHVAPHFFVHRNWIDILGYVEPTYFLSWFQDTWVTTIARQLGRYIYLEDFFLEHMHFTIGKRPHDLTNQEKDVGVGQDHQTWGEKQDELAQDTEKLRKFIKLFNGN